MTDAEKARAYDDLIDKIVADLQAQGWGTPSWRSWDQLRAEVDRLTIALAACEAKLPEEPDVNWQTVANLKTVNDWRATLIEGYRGASITNTEWGTRFYIPGPQNGERCELQTYHGREGERCAYEWGFRIPSHVELSTVDNEGNNTICQHHGNKNAGYTGGIVVRPDGTIAARVKGGKELGLAGSHPYEYENTIPFGTFQRDVVHRVRIECLWDREDGDYRVRLDDGRWEGVAGVPTWPIGGADSVLTEFIMFRLGWYPQKGIVAGATGMEMFTTPLLLQTAV